jgi:drug/metabolite transporter (DMT)-like permease
MTTLSLLLILIAALSHSGWNLLLKKSDNKELFVWWFSVSGAVLLAPLGIVLFLRYPIAAPGHWIVLGAIVLQIFYLIFLGRAYARGDLSLVYPIARGTGPMLVPVLAVLTLGERIEWPAILGIVFVVAGIYTISWWGQFRKIVTNPLSYLREGGVFYALLTGFTITTYSLLDKRGVEYVHPFLYMYLLMVGVSIGLVPYMLRNYSFSQIKGAWTGAWWAIPVAGLLSYVAYASILSAFSLSRVSYIVPAREVSIVVGVLAGVLVLKEPFGRGRLLGSCLIVLGLVLIALSP